MAHEDIRDARHLIREIDFPAERSRWAWWTPGDATRYHVALINAAPGASAVGTVGTGTFRALVITVDLFGTQPISIVIPRPADEDERFTADEWVHRNYPDGWWPGIRPLLAALGWTLASDRDTTYRSTDHHDIAAAEREQGPGRLHP